MTRTLHSISSSREGWAAYSSTFCSDRLAKYLTAKNGQGRPPLWPYARNSLETRFHGHVHSDGPGNPNPHDRRPVADWLRQDAAADIDSVAGLLKLHKAPKRDNVVTFNRARAVVSRRPLLPARRDANRHITTRYVPCDGARSGMSAKETDCTNPRCNTLAARILLP